MIEPRRRISMSPTILYRFCIATKPHVGISRSSSMSRDTPPNPPFARGGEKVADRPELAQRKRREMQISVRPTFHHPRHALPGGPARHCHVTGRTVRQETRRRARANRPRRRADAGWPSAPRRRRRGSPPRPARSSAARGRDRNRSGPGRSGRGDGGPGPAARYVEGRGRRGRAAARSRMEVAAAQSPRR